MHSATGKTTMFGGRVKRHPCFHLCLQSPGLIRCSTRVMLCGALLYISIPLPSPLPSMLQPRVALHPQPVLHSSLPRCTVSPHRAGFCHLNGQADVISLCCILSFCFCISTPCSILCYMLYFMLLCVVCCVILCYRQTPHILDLVVVATSFSLANMPSSNRGRLPPVPNLTTLILCTNETKTSCIYSLSTPTSQSAQN